MARFTYGSETTPKRKELELEKTHANDAIAISGISQLRKNPSILFRIVHSGKNEVCMKPLPEGQRNPIDSNEIRKTPYKRIFE